MDSLLSLKGKTAVVLGGGQSPGEGIGNGRATCLVFARAGARVLVVDRRVDSAQETVDQILAEGGEASALEADVSREAACARVVEDVVATWGRLDILQYNVGIGGGARELTELEVEDWARVQNVNVTGAFLACKHALPVMREQGSGVITCVSSVASLTNVPMLAYKTSKAALNALVNTVATQNAHRGIRCNAILPGMLETPMAIEGISQSLGMDREELRERRASRVPLQGRRGTAWDTAYASLFLASDEGGYITGVLLPVDGGRSAVVGTDNV